MKKLCVRLAVLPLLAWAACVGSSKSSNPLSPVIAGPIAGVGITAPTVLAPAIDALIDTNTQPITFQVTNAETSGVRPLSYRFEIATDPSFTNHVFDKAGIPQDASGRTSMRLPGPLSPERKYFWHARAEDGANSGDFGATSAFSVFTPVVFGAPVLISPINDVTTSAQPRFLLGNAIRTGPAGAVYYLVELSNSGGQVIANYQFPESPNQSDLTAPTSLAAGQYFWRARAWESGGFAGPFSGAQSFRTSGTGGGGGGGGGGPFNPQGSMIDTLNAVRAEFPANWSDEDRGRFLNKVAWIRSQKGEPFGLLKKSGGHNCPTPQGVAVSCDFLVYQPTLNGYDVLISEQTPVWAGLANPSDNFSSDPSRFLAPVQP